MSAIGATLVRVRVWMDETRDIVDVVTRIAKFFEHESCGKCTPAVRVPNGCMNLCRK